MFCPKNISVNFEKSRIDDELEGLDMNKIKRFSFNGVCCKARVYSCHDGDTITVVFKFHNDFIKVSARLDRIDSCEIISKNDLLRTFAIKCKNRLIELISNKSAQNTNFAHDCCIVWIKCHEFDKYGRVLIDLYKNETDTKSVQDILLDENLVLPYNGEMKRPDAEQLYYLNLV
jgi:hypothetical protein